jgi:hypothetical protein
MENIMEKITDFGPITIYDEEYSHVLGSRYSNDDNIALILRRSMDDEKVDELLPDDIILTTNIEPTDDSVVTLSVHDLEDPDYIIQALVEANVLGNPSGFQPSGYVLFPVFEYKGKVPTQNY